MDKLEKQYDIDVHWHSFELRPAGSPPIPPEYLKRIEAGQSALKKRAYDEYGLELHVGPFGINSRPALVLEKYAEEQGKGVEFHTAVMNAYWQEARSIDDPVVLKEIAEQVGLDTANFAAILSNPIYDEAVSADVALAHEYGLTGVPALVFANKYLVMGAQPYEMLKRVADKVVEEGE